MSEATITETQGLQPEPARAQPGRPRAAQRRMTTGQPSDREAEEVTFWTRLEDREEGRLAVEADHLFDTSYAWAT